MSDRTDHQPMTALPAGPTAGMLRAEPEWDPLRADPRFERLVNG